jgi:hypothetical protein
VEASIELAVAVWQKSSGFEVLREPFLVQGNANAQYKLGVF